MTITAALTKRAAEIELIRGAYDVKLTQEAQERLNDVAAVIEEAGQLMDAAAKIVVTDDASDAAAAAQISAIAKLKKRAEELRKFFTAPFDKTKKGIDGRFKEWLEGVLNQDARLRSEGEGWFNEKRRRAAAAEKQQRQQNLKAQREARALGMAAPAPQQAPVEQIDKTVKTAEGSRTIKLVPDFEVFDFAKVSDNFKSIDSPAVREAIRNLDEKTLRAAIDKGEQPFAGIKIFERPQTAAR